MINDKKISVVILAWNQLNETLECIESITASCGIFPYIILVDNGSTDDTSSVILSHYGSLVKVIRSNINLGVSKGYNLGIKHALELGSDYIIITNNDVIFDPCMMLNLINFANRDSKIGIVSPLILNYYNPKKIWMIGARWRKFPPTLKMIAYNETLNNNYKKPMELHYVPSCCYLITRNAISDAGLYDEGYFIYFDDWDYSVRIRQAGYTIWLCPNAIALHKISFSTKKQHKPYKWWRQMGFSASRYYRKHHGKVEQIFGLGWMMTREIIKLNPIEAINFFLGITDEIIKNSHGRI
jgi:GT2 family glycosyltransferase